jgi:hypothetical protein
MTEMSDISKTATLTPVKRPETGPAGPATSRPGGFEPLKAFFQKLDPKNSKNWPKNERNVRYLKNGHPDPRKKAGNGTGRPRDV